MTILHAGFDTIDVALQGAFTQDTIDVLIEARNAAADKQEAALVRIGPENIAVFVAPSGLKGGFAVRVDTGSLGEVLAFKANLNPSEWNGFASIRASTLAAYGYRKAVDRLFAKLSGMGFKVAGHSVNRIDYAVDFLVPEINFRLDSFVAHPRTKVRPYWGETHTDPNSPTAVLTGRKLESVTIGKMPGRQIIVYDKRRAAVAQRSDFWFKVWGVNPDDNAIQICRIEIRAGKKELKGYWNIRTFEDIEKSIGDVIRNALNEIRYMAPSQTDSNVSRQKLDPLWLAMIEHVEMGLFKFRSGLLPSEFKAIERRIAIETYSALILGNLAGLAVATGINDEQIEAKLPLLLMRLLSTALSDTREKFRKSIDRARTRLHFLQ